MIQLIAHIHNGRPVMYLDDLADLLRDLSDAALRLEAAGTPRLGSELTRELGEVVQRAHLDSCLLQHHIHDVHRSYHRSTFDRFIPPV